MIEGAVGTALAGGIFLIAGGVKGVVGFGLPTVCLALFALTTGLIEAMALLLWPSLVTNLIQAVQGGRLRSLLRRLRWMLGTGFLFIFAGALALGHVEGRWLQLLLGLLIMAYAGLGLSGWRPDVPAAREGSVGALAGTANGILTGLTGSFVVPGVLYLNAIGLSRDELVQAMGILFTLSTLGLGLALAGQGLLTLQTSGLSLAGIVPALVGMQLGRLLRQRLDEALFRRLFLMALLGLGGFIALRAIAG